MTYYLLFGLACAALLSLATAPWLIYLRLGAIEDHLHWTNSFLYLYREYMGEPPDDDPDENSDGKRPDNVVAIGQKRGDAA